MEILEALRTRIEVREYADRPVDDGVKRAVLDAGRLASSGHNAQHWHFVLVDDAGRLAELGESSPTGGWVAGAAFAVAVLTDPDLDFHGIDAGRAVTHMQLAAWEHGVGSCLYTTDAAAAEELLAVPDDTALTAVVGFGYPAREIEGIKDRDPLDAVASRGAHGRVLDLDPGE